MLGGVRLLRSLIISSVVALVAGGCSVQLQRDWPETKRLEESLSGFFEAMVVYEERADDTYLLGYWDEENLFAIGLFFEELETALEELELAAVELVDAGESFIAVGGSMEVADGVFVPEAIRILSTWVIEERERTELAFGCVLAGIDIQPFDTEGARACFSEGFTVNGDRWQATIKALDRLLLVPEG